MIDKKLSLYKPSLSCRTENCDTNPRLYITMTSNTSPSVPRSYQVDPRVITPNEQQSQSIQQDSHQRTHAGQATSELETTLYPAYFQISRQSHLSDVFGHYKEYSYSPEYTQKELGSDKHDAQHQESQFSHHQEMLNECDIQKYIDHETSPEGLHILIIPLKWGIPNIQGQNMVVWEPWSRQSIVDNALTMQVTSPMTKLMPQCSPSTRSQR